MNSHRRESANTGVKRIRLQLHGNDGEPSVLRPVEEIWANVEDQELANFAFDAHQVRDAINQRLFDLNKRQRIDTVDAVELLHAIGRYVALHPLDGQATSGASSSSLPARRLPDAEKKR